MNSRRSKLKLSTKDGTDEADDFYGKTVILLTRLAYSPFAIGLVLVSASDMRVVTDALSHLKLYFGW